MFCVFGTIDNPSRFLALKMKEVTTLALPALTETELREALIALDKFKDIGLRSSRFDPELPSGKVISFQRVDNEDGNDSEWVLK